MENAVSYTLSMWMNEAVVVLLILAGVAVLHYLSRRWGMPAEAVLGVILGVSIGFAAVTLYLTSHLWGIYISTRALWFTALYIWCVLGMLFFARHTHRVKLYIGLASQAGILFALFAFL